MLLAQVASSPTTQAIVDQAVSAKTSEWAAPLVAAMVLGGVGLIASFYAVITSWLNTLKAKAALEQAKAEADAKVAEAKADAQLAQIKADAAASATVGLKADINTRMENTSRAVQSAQASATAAQSTAATAMLHVTPPADATKGPTPP